MATQRQRDSAREMMAQLRANPEVQKKRLGRVREYLSSRSREYNVERGLKAWANRSPEERELRLSVLRAWVAVYNPSTKGKAAKGRCAAGPDHFSAKFYFLIAPDKKIIFGPNLAEIVRRHGHLFAQSDLEKYPDGHTKAEAKLRCLFRIVKRKNGTRTFTRSWKGWMAGDRKEMVKNVTLPIGILVRTRPEL